MRSLADDSELIAATLAGDEDAFALLYRRHLPVVLRWCLHQTGNAELAADLAAEVFAQALVSARRYNSEQGELLAWLLGIARNKLRESRRRGRIESGARKRLHFEALPLQDADIERVEELASLDEEVMRLVADLPEEQRLALLHRVVEERSYRQMASQLRCSEAVVRQRVSRGLKTLRAQVKER
ncbi:MAG TPA: RNA polymerase sigma factor [Solirubrobacteraceae bacterium]|jgi:RNA polymerase sigma-70 factor (ECF subfamily)